MFGKCFLQDVLHSLWDEDSAKWGVRIARMIFLTDSGAAQMGESIAHLCRY